jgi:hypothetical protein
MRLPPLGANRIILDVRTQPTVGSRTLHLGLLILTIATIGCASHDTQPLASWGPLAVIPPQQGISTARSVGILRITDFCVLLESRADVALLLWPQDRTTWGGGVIGFRNADGTTATVRDGDAVVLGGGGDSAAESGQSGDSWVRDVEWISPPRESCPFDVRFVVGAVDR